MEGGTMMGELSVYGLRGLFGLVGEGRIEGRRG